MCFYQWWTRACMPCLWKCVPVEWPTVATAETYHPLPHCAHIHWLASINVQQASVNVSACHFFCTEEFSDIPLFQTRFHSFCQTAPLLLSVTQQHVLEYWCEGSIFSAVPPTFTSALMGQHHKMGGITFGAGFIQGQTGGFIQTLYIEEKCWIIQSSQWKITQRC